MRRAHRPSRSGQRNFCPRISIQGDEKILDIGCGDGKITAKVARLVPRGSTVGLDNSREMISFAGANLPPVSWPNLKFQNMEMLRNWSTKTSLISFSPLPACTGYRIMDLFWKGSDAASRTVAGS